MAGSKPRPTLVCMPMRSIDASWLAASLAARWAWSQPCAIRDVLNHFHDTL